MLKSLQLPNPIELTGTTEQLGKAIYWLLCGKKEEEKKQ